MTASKGSRAIPFFLRYVDIATAWKAALFLGVVVFAINMSHGVWAALPAALKQAAYTFFAAGFIVRLCENLVVKKALGVIAFPLAVIIPSLVAIGLTFLVHSLKGTPLPLHSTIPTMLMAPPAFMVWAWRSKKVHLAGESK
jgi:hypothetical protein